MTSKIEIDVADETFLDIDALMELINSAYKEGEAGIMVDTPEKPFIRMLKDELLELI